MFRKAKDISSKNRVKTLDFFVEITALQGVKATNCRNNALTLSYRII